MPIPDSSEQLIVFIRYPRRGQVKTRLVPRLGAAGAADLARSMAEYTVFKARAFARSRGIRIRLAVTGASRRSFARWLGPDLPGVTQRGADLGERMHDAITRVFRSGAKRVVLVGTDVPGLTARHLEQAFKRLKRHDVVLGPARDGGYYLVGLRRPCPALFSGVPWGTPRVLAATRAAARAANLSVGLVDVLADVDRPADLRHWSRALRAAEAAGSLPPISVILPALNEEDRIVSALEPIRRAQACEMIVVDGGSRDRTAALARARGARVIRAAPGRGRQMNAGAAAARGDLLVFVHADTRLPAGFDVAVRQVLSQPGVSAGAFSLRLDAPGRKFRWVERWANRRARWLGLPYGDQGLFMTKESFSRAGRFPEGPILEDVLLLRRLRRLGRIIISFAAAETSARRWLRLGVLRTTFINQTIMIAHSLGWDPECLAAWYRRPGKTAEPPSGRGAGPRRNGAWITRHGIRDRNEG